VLNVPFPAVARAPPVVMKTLRTSEGVVQETRFWFRALKFAMAEEYLFCLYGLFLFLCLLLLLLWGFLLVFVITVVVV